MKRYQIVTYSSKNGLGFNERLDYATQKEARAHLADYRASAGRTKDDPTTAIFDRVKWQYIYIIGVEKWRFVRENERLAMEVKMA